MGTHIQFKVVVAGAFGVGKTTFIRQISQTPVVGTEARTSGTEALLKDSTTVGVEFGTYEIVEPDFRVELRLFGLPGQERFHFMWDIVSEGMDAFIVLVDATSPATWSDAGRVTRHLLDQHPVPVVVGLNRCSGIDIDTQSIATALGLDGPRFQVCDVTDATDSRELLISVLEDLLALEDDDEDEVDEVDEVDDLQPTSYQEL